MLEAGECACVCVCLGSTGFPALLPLASDKVIIL